MFSEHPIDFIEHALSSREKMGLEDNFDSAHCILLRVHIFPDHIVLLICIRPELRKVPFKGHCQSSPPKSFRQALNTWRMISDLRFFNHLFFQFMFLGTPLPFSARFASFHHPLFWSHEIWCLSRSSIKALKAKYLKTDCGVFCTIVAISKHHPSAFFFIYIMGLVLSMYETELKFSIIEVVFPTISSLMKAVNILYSCN